MQNMEINFYNVKILKDYCYIDNFKNPLHYITIVFRDNSEKRVGLNDEEFTRFHSWYYKLK